MNTTLISNKKNLRQFGLVFSSGLALIFGLFFPWLNESLWPIWPWVVSCFFITVALTSANLLKPFYYSWMKVGDILGWLNTRIILGIIFFLIFTPISLIFSLVGRDAMTRKPDASLKSYKTKSVKLDRNRMRDLF